MHHTISTYRRNLLIIVIILGFIALGLLALTDRAGAAPEWHYQASATAGCNADNTGVDVGWNFDNTDSRGIRLTVSLGLRAETYDVPAGQQAAGAFTGLPTPLEAGSVRFAMRWLDGGGGRDSTTRDYAAVTCAPPPPPTALHLTSFTARSVGNRGGCNSASRVIDLSCTVNDAGVGWVSGSCLWGEYFLAQTSRTFVVGDEVSVSGCVDQYDVIFSAPGAPLRVRRR